MTDDLYPIKASMSWISEEDWKLQWNPEQDIQMMLYHEEAKALYKQLKTIFEAGEYPIAPYKDKNQLNLEDFPDIDEWAETLKKDDVEDFFK